MDHNFEEPRAAAPEHQSAATALSNEVNSEMELARGGHGGGGHGGGGHPGGGHPGGGHGGEGHHPGGGHGGEGHPGGGGGWHPGGGGGWHPRPGHGGPSWCPPGEILVTNPFPVPHKECVWRR